MDSQLWETFEKINAGRRAIRHFTSECIPDQDMRAILSTAQLAPSSSNMQAYELHWIRDPSICRNMATACKNQHAALSATAFVVVVAKWRGIAGHYRMFLDYMDNSNLYDEKSRKYHQHRQKEISWFLRLMPLWIFGWARSIASLFTAHATLFPVGRTGLYQWATKNSIFAAQTLLLAAQAREIDSCPMEGFNPFKVAKILNLPRRVVIPLVIALGKKDPQQPLSPQWRLPFEKVVVVH